MLSKAAFIFLSNVFYLNINVIYSCDEKAEFSAAFLLSSVSHDASEFILMIF